MNYLNKSILMMGVISIAFSSCKKDEDGEGELDLKFKTESGYTFTNVTLEPDTTIKIGIEGETAKAKDPIIRFNISESVNNINPVSVYSEDLNTQKYEYDYLYTLTDTVSGNTHTLTFVITNKDGFNAQKSLTIKVE